MRCTTTSGRYQCTHNAGHPGDCEATAPSAAPRIGPYVDVAPARAYLRGRLDASEGNALDGVGRLLEIRRAKDERDLLYRERIWKESASS